MEREDVGLGHMNELPVHSYTFAAEGTSSDWVSGILTHTPLLPSSCHTASDAE